MFFSLLDDLSGDAKACVLVFMVIAFTCCFGALVWGISYVLASRCLA